jgi:fructose-1,6-bisphosphatase I
VLDIEPTDYHQRAPLFIGSPDLVAELLAGADELVRTPAYEAATGLHSVQ